MRTQTASQALACNYPLSRLCHFFFSVQLCLLLRSSSCVPSPQRVPKSAYAFFRSSTRKRDLHVYNFLLNLVQKINQNSSRTLFFLSLRPPPSIFRLSSKKKIPLLSPQLFFSYSQKKNLNPLHHASPPFFACELTFLSFSEFPLLSFLQNTVCLFNMPPQFFLKYIISFPFLFKICFDPKHY